MDPEAVEGCPLETDERLLGGSSGADPAKGGEVDHFDVGVLESLAALFLGLFGIAATERHDVLVTHERTESFEIGHDSRTAPGRKRQFPRRSLTIPFGFGLVEVGIDVEDQKPPAPPQ